eukprot:TRINITY_DN4082_c0_g1_i3.p1 TRINITY_DN4082_c0_g1~~TRINITY_DN4082_c0_g1_i3.p1  ORF type:complete len:746 (-),score=193.96 TRINITY_DN4082_c0_g1_i3:27-2264(-)
MSTSIRSPSASSSSHHANRYTKKQLLSMMPAHPVPPPSDIPAFLMKDSTQGTPGSSSEPRGRRAQGERAAAAVAKGPETLEMKRQKMLAEQQMYREAARRASNGENVPLLPTPPLLPLPTPPLGSFGLLAAPGLPGVTPPASPSLATYMKQAAGTRRPSVPSMRRLDDDGPEEEHDMGIILSPPRKPFASSISQATSGDAPAADALFSPPRKSFPSSQPGGVPAIDLNSPSKKRVSIPDLGAAPRPGERLPGPPTTTTTTTAAPSTTQAKPIERRMSGDRTMDRPAGFGRGAPLEKDSATSNPYSGFTRGGGRGKPPTGERRMSGPVPPPSGLSSSPSGSDSPAAVAAAASIPPGSIDVDSLFAPGSDQLFSKFSWAPNSAKGEARDSSRETTRPAATAVAAADDDTDEVFVSSRFGKWFKDTPKEEGATTTATATHKEGSGAKAAPVDNKQSAPTAQPRTDGPIFTTATISTSTGPSRPTSTSSLEAAFSQASLSSAPPHPHSTQPPPTQEDPPLMSLLRNAFQAYENKLAASAPAPPSTFTAPSSLPPIPPMSMMMANLPGSNMSFLSTPPPSGMSVHMAGISPLVSQNHSTHHGYAPNHPMPSHTPKSGPQDSKDKSAPQHSRHAYPLNNIPGMPPIPSVVMPPGLFPAGFNFPQTHTQPVSSVYMPGPYHGAAPATTPPPMYPDMPGANMALNPSAGGGLERWFGGSILATPTDVLPPMPKAKMVSLSDLEGSIDSSKGKM